MSMSDPNTRAGAQVPNGAEADILRMLERQFLQALELLRIQRESAARALLEEILRAEPRLAEPRLELAILDAHDGALEAAIEHVRMAVDVLDKGGQWTDDLPPHVLRAHARNLLGELLIESAQTDAAVADEELFAATYNEAVALFRQAYDEDPDNEAARRNSVLHRPYAHADETDPPTLEG